MKATAKIFPFVFIVCALFGCSRGTHEVSSFYAFYGNTDTTAAVVEGLPVTFSNGKAKVLLTPRHVVGNEKKTVSFTVEITAPDSWTCESDQVFRDMVAKQLAPAPEDIFGVSLSGMKHAPRKFERLPDIEAFWSYLNERCALRYSMAEVRQLLPEEQADLLPADGGKKQQVVIAWPADKRVMQLRFEEDTASGASVLTSFELGYAKGEE